MVRFPGSFDLVACRVKYLRQQTASGKLISFVQRCMHPDAGVYLDLASSFIATRGTLAFCEIMSE